jgi:hypothetical protein
MVVVIGCDEIMMEKNGCWYVSGVVSMFVCVVYEYHKRIIVRDETIVPVSSLNIAHYLPLILTYQGRTVRFAHVPVGRMEVFACFQPLFFFQRIQRTNNNNNEVTTTTTSTNINNNNRTTLLHNPIYEYI